MRTKIFSKIIYLSLFYLIIFALFSQGAIAKGYIKVSAPKYTVLGEPFKILIHSRQNSPISLYWLGRKITLYPKNKLYSYSLILGSDVKKDRPGYKELKIYAKHIKIIRLIQLKKRRLSITRIRVSKKFSHLTREELHRYFKDQKIIEKILSRFTQKRYFTPHFIRPVPYPITSPYGRVRIINGSKKSIHTGVDYKAPIGSKIRAINSGMVVFIDNQLFTGRSIYIDHGMGIVSMYFHLSKPLVYEGEYVKKGQIIGLSGATGRVSGPHLHLGVSILGKLVDPCALIKKF